MKEAIQPELHEATISCICGAEYTVMSASGDMKVEVCANCHPFYSGKTKRITAGGRIEKFNNKYGKKHDV